MAEQDQWVIDASASDPSTGLYCFCPLNNAGEVMIGFSFISDQPPHHGELVGIYHDDEQSAIAWCEEHADALTLLSNRMKEQSSGQED